MAAAETYGAIRAELELTLQMISNNDLWMAEHALASELTLVPNLVHDKNEKEFRRVQGLKVQNRAVQRVQLLSLRLVFSRTGAAIESRGLDCGK